MKKTKDSFSNVLQFIQLASNENNCMKLLEQSRWHGKPVCAFCNSTEKIYKLKRKHYYRCGKCLKFFNARKGTIFEESQIPLSKWFYAIYIFSNHKKGISSHQLARDLSVTQKTAWFMLGRIREAMRTKTNMQKLYGVIEADETYVGGKPRKGDKKERKRGRGTEKTPVFGMIEREGKVCAMPVKKVNAKTLKGKIKENVEKGSIILTDEWKAYKGIDKNDEYEHYSVNHGQGEFDNNGINVNSMENFWSQMKRGIFGIYHHASKKHLSRYTDEFTFRYNTKGNSENERFNTTLEKVNGRLTYKQLIKKAA